MTANIETMVLGLKGRVITAVTIAALAAVGVGLIAIYALPRAAMTGGVSDCGFSTACSATNSAGFALYLSENATALRPNGTLSFTMQITNPSGIQMNVTSSRNWRVPSMSGMDCNDLYTPFAFAVFKGRYTPDNISSASNIVSGEYQPANFTARCESISQYALSHTYVFYFYPHGSQMQYVSDVCAINEVSPYVFPTTDNWCRFSLQSDRPGTYTLAAGDYWGDLVLLNFSVQ